MNECYNQLLNVQDLLLVKEKEIFLYINTHDIPQDLKTF